MSKKHHKGKPRKRNHGVVPTRPMAPIHKEPEPTPIHKPPVTLAGTFETANPTAFQKLREHLGEVRETPPRLESPAESFTASFDWWDSRNGEYRTTTGAKAVTVAAAKMLMLNLALSQGWRRSFWRRLIRIREMYPEDARTQRSVE